MLIHPMPASNTMILTISYPLVKYWYDYLEGLLTFCYYSQAEVDSEKPTFSDLGKPVNQKITDIYFILSFVEEIFV